MQSRTHRKSKQSGHSKEQNKDLDLERAMSNENIVTTKDNQYSLHNSR